MLPRRSELFALSALVLAVAALALVLHPIGRAAADTPAQSGAAVPSGSGSTAPIPATFNYQGTLRFADGSV